MPSRSSADKLVTRYGQCRIKQAILTYTCFSYSLYHPLSSSAQTMDTLGFLSVIQIHSAHPCTDLIVLIFCQSHLHSYRSVDLTKGLVSEGRRAIFHTEGFRHFGVSLMKMESARTPDNCSRTQKTCKALMTEGFESSSTVKD